MIVEIRDEGAGIPPDIMDHIKAPFFTTKRAYGGTGLGLSISSTIVEEHDGLLQFESLPGQGTTAKLILPVLDAPSPETP